MATACAAAVAGALARVIGQRLRAPSLVVAVPALSALLPGRTIFRGMSEVAAGSTAGVQTLLAALTTALAIGGGVVLGDLVAAPVDRGVMARRAAARARNAAR
nr:threonine/serine exporter family protein [Angustibacter aerolatus]